MNAAHRTFRTDRMQVDMLNDQHRALYVQLYTDPVLMEHIGPPLSQQSADRAFRQSLVEQDGGRGLRLNWIATESHSGQPFAIAGLTLQQERKRAEIGCILLASHHGRGFATELLGRLVEIGFGTLELQAITTFSTLGNIGTRVFLERLGFDRKPGLRGSVKGYYWSIER